MTTRQTAKHHNDNQAHNVGGCGATTRGGSRLSSWQETTYHSCDQLSLLFRRCGCLSPSSSSRVACSALSALTTSCRCSEISARSPSTSISCFRSDVLCLASSSEMRPSSSCVFRPKDSICMIFSEFIAVAALSSPRSLSASARADSCVVSRSASLFHKLSPTACLATRRARAFSMTPAFSARRVARSAAFVLASWSDLFLAS